MTIIDETREVPFAPRRRPVQLVPEVPSDDEVRTMLGREAGTVEDVLAETDLQRIAKLVGALTYGDMKALAAGVLAKDDQAEIIVLADKLHEWSQRTRSAA